MAEQQDPTGAETMEAPPTPMSAFARQVTSSDLLPARLASGQQETSLALGSAARSRESLGRLRDTTAAQDVERTAARPTPVTVPTAPSTAARPFLSVGPNVLDQLQGAIAGVTQIALGVGGLKGRGHAIAAVAGLKGALEGWQHGDRERVDAALTEWHANSKALLENHRIRRESYLDLLGDQKRSVDQILAEMEITAKIDGDEQLAVAAHSRNLDSVINHLSQQETKAASLGMQQKRLDAEIEHWKSDSTRHERDFAATQVHRAAQERRAAESGARAERGLKLREETSRAVVTLQGQETGLAQKLENAGVVREAVDLLDKEGILPRGATVWDTAKSKLALQSKPGRTDIANAVQIVNRLGTPLVIGTEVGLGTTGGALRLKVVGEAEAGNLIGAPKEFWDLFLPMAEKKWAADRNIARQHLERLGRLPPGDAEPEILWKE